MLLFRRASGLDVSIIFWNSEELQKEDTLYIYVNQCMIVIPLRYLHAFLTIRPIRPQPLVLFVGRDVRALRVEVDSSPARGIFDAQWRLVFAFSLLMVVLKMGREVIIVDSKYLKHRYPVPLANIVEKFSPLGCSGDAPHTGCTVRSTTASPFT